MRSAIRATADGTPTRSRPVFGKLCCGMINNVLRSRSGRDKMSVNIGDLRDMNPRQAKLLGRHLRSTRQEMGISARELARRTDLPDSTVVRIEQGAFAEPSPEKLQRMAAVLGLNLADLYVMADYPVPNQLPTLTPYLRTKYRDLPEGDVKAISAYAAKLMKRRGVELAGPAPGEDEQLNAPTANKHKTKGGTR